MKNLTYKLYYCTDGAETYQCELDYRNRVKDKDDCFEFHTMLARADIRSISMLITGRQDPGGYWLIKCTDGCTWDGDVYRMQYIDARCREENFLKMALYFRLWEMQMPIDERPAPAWAEPTGMIISCVAGLLALTHTVAIIITQTEFVQAQAILRHVPFWVSYLAAFICGILLMWWEKWAKLWTRYKNK